ncbi:hypothetical protein HMPREF0860_0787 [Treponema socranskii subsp. socranskii VPI DR56BR1116 = ATCC 35536]|uniref:Uncharacterized protein n=1 Tax=Treponema socranskii subsp. socranskii VPI DR56BR1116 = ATCC 35536 TaxID=1125725 RepID=U1FB79_TRESO|nr:hypothetical protein HMPREF1325_2169 [Treponema socranskii subsp. socranskii VPI DR56BR1116 = ATCC 35536]ERK04512.1 hypothetical protein HMPREF0860_0787 [Treponema socranskii subsp. socranskii VPI DR56BR1116 = ATCC 35536]
MYGTDAASQRCKTAVKVCKNYTGERYMDYLARSSFVLTFRILAIQ